MERLTFIALSVAAVAGNAEAVTRRVCFELRFKDNRSPANCALSSETGNRRGCNNGQDLDHMGAVVELWDKDPDGSDELIGLWEYQYAGGNCAEFEWDNNSTANAEHEANPEVRTITDEAALQAGEACWRSLRRTLASMADSPRLELGSAERRAT